MSKVSPPGCRTTPVARTRGRSRRRAMPKEHMREQQRRLRSADLSFSGTSSQPPFSRRPRHIRHFPGGKIAFQSFFMSTTVQPCALASSKPCRACRSWIAGRRRIRARRRCGERCRQSARRRPPRPLQHLQVAVGIAEGEDRPAPDEAIDADGLARAVVDEFDLRRLISTACRPAPSGIRRRRTSRPPARAECRRPSRPRAA